MAHPRHKAVQQPRLTTRLRTRSSKPGSPVLRRFAAPGAAVAILLATCAGAVAWPDADQGAEPRATMSTTQSADRDASTSRANAISRSAPRPTLKPKATKKATPKPTPKASPTPEAVDELYVTVPLNLWTGPGEDTTLLDVLAPGTKVGVTGKTDGEWAEVVREGTSRWVREAYLSNDKPQAEEESEGGISDAECPSGSEVEEGLTDNAVRVHRAVCAEFPDVTSFGGLRSDGMHGDGRALDIMVSNEALGDQIADWAQSNAGELGISEVIWWQQIWTVLRSSEGWRSMEDRGSPTANHYDHVHITVE
ncbi:MAG: SH3 domain-containing protein [Nocardioidaceae bacterium]